MDIIITKDIPEFSVVNHKKRVVFVEFPNCISTKTGESFKWCPTYEQLIMIRTALNEIETESWQKKE